MSKYADHKLSKKRIMYATNNRYKNNFSAPYSYRPCIREQDMYDPSTSRKDFQNFVNSSCKDKMNISDKVWNGILIQIEELVELSKNTVNAELEVHIGRLERDHRKRFRSGVSIIWFNEQLKKMESFENWDYYSKEWEKIEEYVYDRDIRLRRNPDGIGTFMKKTLIKGIDIQMDDAKYDIRIVLKSENDSHINYGDPNYVRYKQRKIFTHKNFTYFFTEIWEGKDKKQACSRSPKYEIELECTKMSNDISYITKSMLIKCKDLIGKSYVEHDKTEYRKNVESRKDTETRKDTEYNEYRNDTQDRKRYDNKRKYETMYYSPQQQSLVDNIPATTDNVPADTAGEEFIKGIRDLYKKLVPNATLNVNPQSEYIPPTNVIPNNIITPYSTVLYNPYVQIPQYAPIFNSGFNKTAP